MDMVSLLKQMQRSAIRLTIGGTAHTRVGASRFGGVPDVPEDFNWPVFETASFDDDEVKARPLAFLAQINCAEAATLAPDEFLPQTGILSFFYELGSQRWGFDPADAGCARVFWFEDVDALKPAMVPDALPEDFCLPALDVCMQSEASLPGWEDFAAAYPDTGDWEAFDALRSSLGCEWPANRSALLGWPDVIQNSMTFECEMVSRGHYLGGGSQGLPEADAAYAKTHSLEDWQLLFQLDTVSSGSFELMFGDCGRIYFYIRREDLKERRFDRVWLILQCG
ncbi:MAG: DUF1963 domain-containing protein [Oscillospiraceae bacterium]|nr:DUF1963 domain-containing protein [Oscillospiraceae bacterium]